MSAADDEADGGEDVAARAEAAGVEVGFDVVDRDEGDVEDHRERFGGSRGRRGGADESGFGDDGDGREVRGGDARRW